MSCALLLLSGCGSAATPTIRPDSGGSGGGAAVGTAAAGPCSSVTTTTPIDKVPAACAALWRPYEVTEVPPADLLTHVPAAPAVDDQTAGAVSPADAQAWANAANRASGWFQWGEANGQWRFLGHVLAVGILSPDEARILGEGGRVNQPACVLYPAQVRLFPIDATAKQYFIRNQHFTTASFVLVGTYMPTCTVTDVDASGKQGTLGTLSAPSTAFKAGVLKNDPVLGAIWFQDAFGNCVDVGHPLSWCAT